MTTDEDTAYAFDASDFGFADADTGDGLASVRVVTLPGSGTLAVSGRAVSVDQEVTASNLGGNLTYTPAGGRARQRLRELHVPGERRDR